VDGPLLHLKRPEEQAFFKPFKTLFGIEGLSSNWNSYKVRNDRDIVLEVLEAHLGDELGPHHYDSFVDAYDAELKDGFSSGRLQVTLVDKARELVQALSDVAGMALGIATANLRCAAEIRLRHAGLWDHVSAYPGTSDKGGHKHQVLARVIDDLGLPPERVVFIGDNLNDLEAGRKNATHFIGYHWTKEKRQRLRDSGASHVTDDHDETLALINQMLKL
jgi:phosphoglycolate phosphatase-like HAD superfamily hydrolase